jgi:hypothetical protein
MSPPVVWEAREKEEGRRVERKIGEGKKPPPLPLRNSSFNCRHKFHSVKGFSEYGL